MQPARTSGIFRLRNRGNADRLHFGVRVLSKCVAVVNVAGVLVLEKSQHRVAIAVNVAISSVCPVADRMLDTGTVGSKDQYNM